MTREEALARLRAQIDAGRPIIGAGAGTGLSAKCAEAGGADLIIIYNSGRYRMAGRGSLAGILAYGDANAIVVDMSGLTRIEVDPAETHEGVCRELSLAERVVAERVLWRDLHQLRPVGTGARAHEP